MPTIYVPRVFGGTLVITTGGIGTVPYTLFEQVTTQRRDMNVTATRRDMNVTATRRDEAIITQS